MKEESLKENIDRTIMAICNHIQNIAKPDNAFIPENMPEEIKALSELVTARARFDYEF